MNAFEKIFEAIGLNEHSQNELGWLHSLLVYGSTDYEGADVFTTNPVKEALRRLDSRGVGAFTRSRISQMLHTLQNEYESGARQ